ASRQQEEETQRARELEEAKAQAAREQQARDEQAETERARQLQEAQKTRDEEAALAAQEEQEFANSTGDAQKLQVYINSCRICLFKIPAGQQIASLQEKAAEEKRN